MVTLPEAKLLLKEDDDLIIAVYDYWLNKRLRLVSMSAQIFVVIDGWWWVGFFFLGGGGGGGGHLSVCISTDIFRRACA